MDPGDNDEPSREELVERVDQLEANQAEQRGWWQDALPSRRGVLTAGAGLGLGALLSGSASGQSAAGQVGTPSSPEDVFAYNLDVQNGATFNGSDVTGVGSLSTDETIVTAGSVSDGVSQASEGDTIIVSRGNGETVSSSININVPDVTIIGASVSLADDADTDPIRITAGGVTLMRPTVDGNKANNSSQSGNCVRVEASGVTILSPVCNNSPRHGIWVDGENNTLDGVTIKDVRGSAMERDLVSLSGPNLSDVEVIGARGYNSEMRGTLEIADGVTGAYISDIYGEGQSYVVSYEDHGGAGEDHHDVTIENVRGSNVDRAVKTGTNVGIGHQDLTIRDVYGSYADYAIQVHYVDGLHIENVHTRNTDFVTLEVDSCNDVSINNVMVAGPNTSASQVIVNNCNRAEVHGVITTDVGSANGLFLKIDADQTFSHFTIQNCHIVGATGDDIRIRNDSSSGTLERYIVTDNFADVVDNPADGNSIVKDNITPEQ